MNDDKPAPVKRFVVFQRGIVVDRDGNVSDDPRIKPIGHEVAGSGYDSGARGYELQAVPSAASTTSQP